jgi:hypothetical protein
MVEIWFGIKSRKALRCGSFRNLEDLEQAIRELCEMYNIDVNPFTWRKREVKGSQLRNTLKNFCN